MYEHAAETFVAEQLNFPGSYVVTRQVDARARTINVLLVGRFVDTTRLRPAQQQLARYDLQPTRLIVRQGLQAYDSLDANTLRQNLLEDVRARQSQTQSQYAAELARLQQLVTATQTGLPAAADLLREVQVEYPAVRRLALSQLARPAQPLDSLPADTVLVVSLDVRPLLAAAEQQRLARWLRIRTKRQRLELLLEPILAPPPVRGRPGSN